MTTQPKRTNPYSDYYFHPFEISFCGYSGSGKTTLLEKVLKQLSPHFKVGFVKHDAHKFVMDKDGKDTDVAWKAGAYEVYISDKTHKAHLSNRPDDLTHRKKAFLNSDFVLVEGFKFLPIAKMIVLDSENTIMERYETGDLDPVVGFIGSNKRPSNIPAHVPFFHRNDTNAIANFVLQYFKQKLQQTPLNGLILTGGQSKRMKTDKALLKYHGKTQIEHCYDLLTPFCKKIFVSSQKNQWSEKITKYVPVLEDEFLNLGPMGGILTAMKSQPQTAWLVLACDLPFLDSQTLHQLAQARNPFKMGTCFKSESFKGGVEPLCTIYEPKIYSHLFDFVGLGYTCPRKALMNAEIQQLQLQKSTALDNANFPEEYLSALDLTAQELL